MIGATVRYATADRDGGPTIKQEIVRSTRRKSVEDLSRQIAAMGRTALARAVKWRHQATVFVQINTAVVL